jgi:hypothetical protein
MKHAPPGRIQPQFHRINTSPLSDNRFHDLLAQASSFFEAAEIDKDVRRQEVIDEILATMRYHSITVQDLD